MVLAVETNEQENRFICSNLITPFVQHPEAVGVVYVLHNVTTRRHKDMVFSHLINITVTENSVRKIIRPDMVETEELVVHCTRSAPYSSSS